MAGGKDRIEEAGNGNARQGSDLSIPAPLKPLRRKALQRINQTESRHALRVPFQKPVPPERRGRRRAELHDYAARGDDNQAAHGGFGGAQQDEQSPADIARHQPSRPGQSRPRRTAPQNGDKPLAVAFDDVGPVHGVLPVHKIWRDYVAGLGVGDRISGKNDKVLKRIANLCALSANEFRRQCAQLLRAGDQRCNFGAGNWPHSHRNSVRCAAWLHRFRKRKRLPQQCGRSCRGQNCGDRAANCPRRCWKVASAAVQSNWAHCRRNSEGERTPSSPRPVSGLVIEFGKSRACGPADGTNLWRVWLATRPVTAFCPGWRMGRSF